MFVLLSCAHLYKIKTFNSIQFNCHFCVLHVYQCTVTTGFSLNVYAIIAVTKPAPEWKGTAVINGKFEEISLSSFRGKYLVFFFYPLDL